MTSIDTYLEDVRSHFERVVSEGLDAEIDDGAILVDIRNSELRSRDGEMPGALIIDRNVLEWRLASSSDARIIDLEPNQRVIIMCNEGYQSSLAARTLQELGVTGATDLVGGYQAWLQHRG